MVFLKGMAGSALEPTERVKTTSLLDRFLDGGFEREGVNALVGEAGSGKTLISTILSLSVLKKGRGKVAYIDTEGGLSAERVLQLDGKAQLKDILLKRAHDFRSQEEAILALPRQKGLSAVVVDSIVGNYRLLLRDSTAREANIKLSAQLGELNKLSIERKIPVIVTGHTYRKKDGTAGITGGNVMGYLPKTIVLLEKLGEAGKRRATIVKSRSLPEGKTLEFSIGEKGIY